jgi:hypothetical protein
MPPFTYRCPITGDCVRGFIAEGVPDNNDTSGTILCTMCQQIHLVDRETGEILQEDDEDEAP